MEQFTQIAAAKEEGFFPAGNYQAYKLNHKLPIVLTDPQRGRGSPDIDSLVLEVRINDMNLITRASAKALDPGEIINYKSRYMIYVFGSFPSVYALGRL